MKLRAQDVTLAGLLLVVILAGCTSSHYRKSADKEAYRAIRAKSSLVTNMDSNFHIEQTNILSLTGLPIATNVEEFLGPEGERERGARVLGLEDALALAIDFSRNYQTRKEQLYASALDLADVLEPRQRRQGGWLGCRFLCGHLSGGSRTRRGPGVRKVCPF